jgi:hypothetical protein
LPKPKATSGKFSIKDMLMPVGSIAILDAASFATRYPVSSLLSKPHDPEFYPRLAALTA